MAPRIYLEAKEVFTEILGVSVGTNHGHLYLVLRDDSNPTDTPEVIRGGVPIEGGTKLDIEIGSLATSQDAYDRGTPQNERFSIDITDLIPGGVGAWNSLSSFAVGLDGAYQYDIAGAPGTNVDGGPIANSNSTILTVLNTVGVDVRELVERSDFGHFGSQYAGVNYFGNSYGTLLGSGSEEWIIANSALGDQGLVLLGREDFNDGMIGTNSDDFYYGQGGDDFAYAGLGSDYLDGGENADNSADSDTLSYQGIDTGVTINLLTAATNDAAAVFQATEIGATEWTDTFTNFENLILSTKHYDEVLFDPEMFNLNVIDAGGSLEKGDLLDGLGLDGGITVNLQGVNDDPGAITLGSDTLSISNFDNVIGTDHVDNITGSDTGNTIDGGAGNDVIDGGLGHDSLFGGLGSDEIEGGDGADLLFDNAVNLPEDGQPADFELIAYDGTGNDTLNGGAGADVLVHSGGVDVFNGGAGNDLYLTSEQTQLSDVATDDLTIVLSGDFGHDLIAGGPDGVDTVVFEGINSSDITVNYQYGDPTLVNTHYFNYDPLIGWWFDSSSMEIGVFQTVGTLEIIVNATGASITVENVTGSYTEVLSGTGSIQPTAFVHNPFDLMFDDGLLDLNSVLVSGGSITNSPVSDTAFDALGALDEERSVPEDTIDGEGTDNELYGTTAANEMNGYEGNDTLFGGSGSDVLSGGEGADYMNGGTGIDTASYAGATSGVGLRLFDTGFRSGEAVGDELVSIENLVGSAFDDLLIGDEFANVIHGGAGSDTLGGGRYGEGDTLYGEAGDDRLTGLTGNDLLDGGEGNDTLQAGSGDDTLLGGAGDDLLISDGNVVNITEILSPGSDLLDGGVGTDTAEFYHDGGLVVDLAAGRADFGGTDDFTTLVNIENVTTGWGDDLIRGDDGANVLDGSKGDDTILGGGGDDTLIGNDGNDVIFGGAGIDTAQLNVVSTAVTYEYVDGGVRVVIDDTHPDFTHGMETGTVIIYDDVENIAFTDQTVSYGTIAGPLQTEFEVIDDNLRADEGQTVTIDLLANDLEFGGDPIGLTHINGVAVSPGDTIRLASGALITVLTNGQIEFDQEGAYAALNEGETAVQVLTYTATDSSGVEKTATATIVFDGVASGTDQVHIENNLVLVESDPDNAAATRVANFDIARSVVVIDGVYVDPNDPPTGVTFDEIDGDTYILFGSDDAVILSDVSLAAWQHVSAQQTSGSTGNDLINGTTGDDVLTGGDGHDTINAGSGDDVVIGGDGNDDLVLSEGDDLAIGGNGDDDIDGFEGDDLIYGNAGDDSLSGGLGDDTLIGGSGDDEFWGNDGNDEYFGGAGNDTFYGSAGQNMYDGGEGTDFLNLYWYFSYEGYPGAVINLQAGILSWHDLFPPEQLISIENVWGTEGDDLIIGDDGANNLGGGIGSDTIFGHGGNDTLYTAGDNVLMDGGEGDDRITSQGPGEYELIGGTGNDTLRGGAGNDHYVYALGDGHDLITETTGGGTDRLMLTDVPSGRITLAKDVSGDDLVISFPDGGTITVQDFFAAPGTTLEMIEFSDGDVMTETEIRQFVAAEFVNTNWSNTSTVLQTGVENTSQFGNSWNGLTDADGKVDIGFTSDGSPMELKLTGYDIDFTDEIAIYINDEFHSYLDLGPNNGLTDYVIYIGSDALLFGQNIVTFENTNPSWTWGLTDFTIDNFVDIHWNDVSEVLQTGVASSGQYGNNWNGLTDADGKLEVGFVADGSAMELSLTGFDIDFADEISIYLNGEFHSHLSVGQDEALTPHSIVFEADELLHGNNIVTFENKDSSWKWGIENLLVQDYVEPNAAPVADPLSIAANEVDGSISIDLSGIVTDADVDDTLTITSLTTDFFGGTTDVPFSEGVVTGEGGELFIDPVFFGLEDGEVETITLTYTVEDEHGASDSETITLTLTGHTPTVGNTPPEALNVLGVPGYPAGTDDQGNAIPADVIVDDPATTSLTIDLTALISDPDGDPLTIVPGDLRIGFDETTGTPITVPYTFNSTNGTVTISFADLGLADGESVVGTLTYSVTDGTDTTTGQVTLNFVDPAVDPGPQQIALDFESFADPAGYQIDLSDDSYAGLSFSGSAIVIETDEVTAGHGRDGVINYSAGQTTTGGSNLLVGNTTTIDVPVLDQVTGEPVIDPSTRLPVTTTEIDEIFGVFGAGATFDFNDQGLYLTDAPSGTPPTLPTELPDGVGASFDLDGISLSVLADGVTTITVTTYIIDVVEGGLAEGSSGDSEYFLHYAEADEFVFNVDSSNPPLEIDFNDPAFEDALGNDNSAALDDIYAISIETDNGAAILIDDVLVTF
ncbi:beta strand repeat-containing protein [Roseovarius sp. 2305UL8-3]|uniref:beta strand repeat-containing protein n=1 Tax=Roseovarius conchicola TaxID=3121636 RepID=UPI003528BA57